MLVPEFGRDFVFRSLSDVRQIFHAYCRNAVIYSKFYDILGYLMVDGSHKPCLSACYFSKSSHRRSSAQISTACLLQSLAFLGSDVSVVLDFTTCEKLALLLRGRCNRQTINTDINTHESGCINYILVWNILRTGQMEKVSSVFV
jgi:hypothetical protein